MDLTQQINESVTAIKQRLGDDIPDVAVILGSGLGSFVDAIETREQISYADIPHFPKPGVAGHAGTLFVGKMNGRDIFCLQGRVHSYEGQQPTYMTIPVRTLKTLGVKTLVITSAVGSLKESMPAGSLMMVNDHINMSGVSPLAGPNDEAYGPRFPDLSMAYPVAQRELLSAAAKRLELTLHEGVFLMVRGPHFETPAEIRAFQHMGADVVGMSMVPEVILANHCGLTVAAVAMVTNLGAGMTEGVLSHEETLSEGAKAAGNMAKLLAEYLPTA
jgi:xanthosine phosphorylase